MKIIKKGRIFIPQEYQLDYAKSPQALVFDDKVRVYFSSCFPDDKGKLISRIYYVDYNKTFEHVLSVSKTPVITDGPMGNFDEHGIFPFSPIKMKNGEIWAYTSGWTRRVSVSADSAIGLAISKDEGENFIRYSNGGPVLSATLKEPFLVDDGFAIKDGNHYRMWYIFGTAWKNYAESTIPERTYKIATASSTDGIHWNKDNEGVQIISDAIEDEAQALPSVIKVGSTYHMFFCYRDSADFRSNSKKSYRIGYAHSGDGIEWIRESFLTDINEDNEEWEAEMHCYPNIFCVNDKVYLLYNGNQFGRYGFGLAEIEL
jgi:hypothetical protein